MGTRFKFEIVRELDINLLKFTPGQPPYISGPPENCYEATNDEIIYTATCPSTGQEIMLTSDERKDLIAHIKDELEDEQAEAKVCQREKY